MTDPAASTAEPLASLAELELKAVLDAAVDAVVVIDSSGTIETFNRAAERLFGYSASELLGQNVALLMPEPHQSRHDAYLGHHLQTGQRKVIGRGREMTARRSDGTLFPIFLSVGRVTGPGKPRFVGLMSDISERRRVENAMRRERDRAQAYLDLAEVILLAVDREGKVTLINRKGSEIMGWEERDLLGRDWLETCVPEAQREAARHLHHLVVGDIAAPGQYSEHEVITRSGEHKLVAWRHSPLRDELGTVIGSLSSGEDITERRLAEESLRKSEQLLTDAQAIAGLGNFEIGLDHEHTYWSREMFHILGMPSLQAPLPLAEFLDRHVHVADRERLETAWRRMVREDGEMDLGYRLVRADGHLRHVHSLARIAKDPQGRRQVTGTIHDVTESQQAQEEIRQAQERMTQFARLSTMGEMAAGLAHEINQPLTAITNYSQALKRMLASSAEQDPEDIELALSQISAQALRAGEVIRRLRSFVKNREARTEPIAPSRLVSELLALVEPDARLNDIRLKVEMDDPLPDLTCDPVQIQQVLINLVRNAIDATNEANALDREVLLEVRRHDGDVVISVADHGPGISAEVAAHLGDPFYTTKSSGTGLGIAISRSILRAHGGKLGHRPTPGGGATVFFTLPVLSGREQ